MRGVARIEQQTLPCSLPITDQAVIQAPRRDRRRSKLVVVGVVLALTVAACSPLNDNRSSRPPPPPSQCTPGEIEEVVLGVEEIHDSQGNIWPREILRGRRCGPDGIWSKWQTTGD